MRLQNTSVQTGRTLLKYKLATFWVDGVAFNTFSV